MGDYHEARRVLEQAASADPDSPHILYSLGLIMERLAHEEVDEAGNEATEVSANAAQMAFSRANALDPSQFPIPLDVSDEFFHDAVDEALANLPRSVKEYIENVPVLIENFPSGDVVSRERVSPQILGMFIGVPRTEAIMTEQVPDLDRVMIYKSNLEKICRDREDLIEQIQITVRHEIGHYLGMDENDLDRLGLA